MPTLSFHSNEHASPALTTRDILTQSVSTDLLPLDLLPRDGQLSPETLESTLSHAHKCPVQLFLVIALGRGDARDD